jgi:hypothetical protein
MGIQGKERQFSENKPLKAPLTWHEIVRSEKQENELFSSPDVFISTFEILGVNSVQLRYISDIGVLEGEFPRISPGLYVETNIPSELLDDPILINDIILEVASLLTKKGKSKVTAELPPDLASLVPDLDGEQINLDFGNAFELKTVFCADHEGTVFEITPLPLSQAVDGVTKAIKGETDGSIILKP